MNNPVGNLGLVGLGIGDTITACTLVVQAVVKVTSKVNGNETKKEPASVAILV